MKFGEKYELLESLTTGAIETFAANDKVRGERVLVHIVDCAPQKPDQTAAEWVLESFRRLAPELSGPVLETGKYSGTKYAYIVVRPVDDAAIKNWVRRYELQAQETRETSVHVLKAEMIAPPEVPPIPVAPKEPPPAPSQMTQLFRDFDSLAKSRSPLVGTPENAAPLQTAPSTSMPGESGLHMAVPWDPANVRVSTPAKEPPVVVPPSSAKSVAPEPQSPVMKDGSKPGEFTSFFQGPFRGDGPSEMPALSSQPMEAPRKKVGEFTALFGQVAPPAPTGGSGSNAPNPSFTGMFKDMETPKQTFNASAPMQGGVVPPPVEPLPTVPPMNMTPVPEPSIYAAPPMPVAVPNPAPVIPLTPSVPVERPLPARSSSLPGDGATGAFLRPASEPAPIPVEVPSGPSPYTQIISRSKLAGAEDAGAGQNASGGADAGKFAAPSMPKIPGAAPPPMPKITPPPMPKMTPPAAPKAPKVDVPTAPTVSYWPLIITLTVVFFLAVLVVLYFALKH